MSSGPRALEFSADKQATHSLKVPIYLWGGEQEAIKPKTSKESSETTKTGAFSHPAGSEQHV